MYYQHLYVIIPSFLLKFEKKKSRKVTFNIFMSSVNFWPVSVDSSLSRWNIFCGPFSRFGTKNTYWSKSKASVRSLVVTKKILVIIKYCLALFWNWSGQQQKSSVLDHMKQDSFSFSDWAGRTAIWPFT